MLGFSGCRRGGTCFVVDNSRSDDIMRFCHQRANVEYVQSDNRGYGAGHNQGIARVSGLVLTIIWS